ncbi:RagB/SusD family nutrient uptake outer membrane protein [Galbibacter sp. PAP.153]|uniref:RagB/SusD family nutrient uptake outer membrane protein n=1 Tax=Galbibacter sp. PAP.153 TaxID=3104623 RepID=UPI00300AA260
MKIFNIKLLIPLVSVLVLVSCEKDLLNTEPSNELSNANFWKTQKDALNAVNAMYAFLPDYNEVEWDRMTDIATTNSPAQQTVTIERGEHDASLSRFKSNWDGGYQAIRAANYFLENIDKVREEDPSVSQDIINRYKAEVRFVRAFFYVRLTMLFGDVPLITRTLNIEESKEITRDPQQQIWDFVATEFDEIKNELPKAYSGNDIGRITKGAALSMKARAMLYAGRWNEASVAAKEVMDLGEYELYPNFKDLFSYEAENSNEIILDRQRAKDVAAHNFFASHAPVSLNGSVGICPTQTLANAYETVNGLPIGEDNSYNPLNPYANRDPRMGYTMFIPTFSDDVPGDVLFNGQVYDPRPDSGTGDEIEVDFYRTKTGYSIKKYINEEELNDRSNGGVNFILIRYADVLLMYAEAKIEMGSIDQSVYDAINEIRGRNDVNMPAIAQGLSQTELRKVVRHERMVELALEGLRFFDLRRWKTAENLMKGVIPGMNYIPIGKPTEASAIEELTYGGTTRAFNPNRDYLFPIPQEERILVPSLEQNPNY